MFLLSVQCIAYIYVPHIYGGSKWLCGVVPQGILNSLILCFGNYVVLIQICSD